MCGSCSLAVGACAVYLVNAHYTRNAQKHGIAKGALRAIGQGSPLCGQEVFRQRNAEMPRHRDAETTG
jgi:hypothetical protein